MWLWILVGIVLWGTPVASQQLAFPSAQGFGRFASGGRGGAACIVTTLADSGTGSLRDCLTRTGKRIITFRVAGTITLSTNIDPGGGIPSDVTIACHSAPGEGILIKNKRLIFRGTRNLILRFCRLRAGEPTPPDTISQGLTIQSGTVGPATVMLDHLSVGWGSDDIMILDAQNVQQPMDITVQWSLFSESIKMPGDTFSTAARGLGVGIMNAGSRVTWHHNLFANASKRGPHMQGGLVQVVNNVTHNLNTTEVIYMLAKRSRILANLVNNYMSASSSGTGTILNLGCGASGYTCVPANEAATNLYLHGNVHTVRRPDASVGSETAMVITSGTPLTMQSTTPQAGFPALPSQTSAVQARLDVLERVGATVPGRDAIDTRAVNDVINNTGRQCGQGTQPNSLCLTYPTIPAATPPADTDMDGIPNTWESANGLNPTNPADAPLISANGYSHLENYLNELAGDTVQASPTFVAHYPFEGSAADVVGGHPGTLVGSPTFTTGQEGQAIALTGTQYVTVPHDTSLNPTSAFTFMTWARFDALDTPGGPSGRTLVQKGDWNGANSYGLVVYNDISAEDALRCSIGRNFDDGVKVPTSTLITGIWYHLACRADASGHALLVNGSVVASNAVAAQSVTATLPLTIGTLSANTAVSRFVGLLDDVRIYPVALSDADIAAIVALGSGDVTPPARSLPTPTGILPSTTTSVEFGLTTEAGATCKYSDTPGMAFASMPATFAQTGSTEHRTTDTGLQGGVSRTWYARCQDARGNTNITDTSMSYSIAETPPPTFVSAAVQDATPCVVTVAHLSPGGLLGPATGCSGYTLTRDTGGGPAAWTLSSCAANPPVGMDLTMTPCLGEGEGATIAYTPGNVVDATGAPLGAFAAQPVTNGVNVPAPVVGTLALTNAQCRAANIAGEALAAPTTIREAWLNGACPIPAGATVQFHLEFQCSVADCPASEYTLQAYDSVDSSNAVPDHESPNWYDVGSDCATRFACFGIDVTVGDSDPVSTSLTPGGCQLDGGRVQEAAAVDRPPYPIAVGHCGKTVGIVQLAPTMPRSRAVDLRVVRKGGARFEAYAPTPAGRLIATQPSATF